MKLRSSTVKKRADDSNAREAISHAGSRARRAIIALSPNILMDRIQSVRPSAQIPQSDNSARTTDTTAATVPSQPNFDQTSRIDSTQTPLMAPSQSSYNTPPADVHPATSSPPAALSHPAPTARPPVHPPIPATSEIALLKAQLAALQDQLENLEQEKLSREANARILANTRTSIDASNLQTAIDQSLLPEHQSTVDNRFEGVADVLTDAVNYNALLNTRLAKLEESPLPTPEPDTTDLQQELHLADSNPEFCPPYDSDLKPAAAPTINPYKEHSVPDQTQYDPTLPSGSSNYLSHSNTQRYSSTAHPSVSKPPPTDYNAPNRQPYVLSSSSIAVPGDCSYLTDRWCVLYIF